MKATRKKQDRPAQWGVMNVKNRGLRLVANGLATKNNMCSYLSLRFAIEAMEFNALN
jgi:hypothetical protein